MTPSRERPGIAVLIPALNEEEAIPHILREMPPSIDRVVVVDNGSTDNTAQVAAELGAEVVREPNHGYGAACLAGIRHLAQLPDPPNVLVFMDADGSDDPSEMGILVAPILRGEADMVLGVRKGADGDVGTILPHARFGNRLVLGITEALFGESFRDLPPFRAIAFDRLLALEMDDQDWGWTLQMQIRAAVEGLRMREVEVTHRRREIGESKISGSLTMSLRVGAKMFYTLARERIRSD